MKAHLENTISNAKIPVKGFVIDKSCVMKKENFICIVSNDNIGKTLTIHNADTGFTIPFEPIERYLK